MRFGGQFLGGNDTNKLYYSLDGKAWTEKEFTYAQAPKVSANPRRSVIADYETVDSLPEGTRAVWVKFWFRRNGPIKDPYKLSLATALRVDADYVPVVGGTPAPVDVIYHYVERHGDRQVEKTHVQTIRQYPTTYKVTVAGDKEPFMRWVEVRLAGQGPASRLTDEKP